MGFYYLKRDIIGDELGTYRLICAVAMLAYVLFGLAFLLNGYESYDPIPLNQRGVISLALGVLLVLSYYNKNIRAQFSKWMLGFLLMATIHVLFLVYMMDFSFYMIVSLNVVIILVNLTMQRPQYLIWYNAIILPLAALALLSSDLAPLLMCVYMGLLVLGSLPFYLMSGSRLAVLRKEQELLAHNLHDLLTDKMRNYLAVISVTADMAQWSKDTERLRTINASVEEITKIIDKCLELLEKIEQLNKQVRE